MIQDLSGSSCIKGTDESTQVTDSSVPLMHHDPDRSWITDPDPDHPKGTHPKKPSVSGRILREFADSPDRPRLMAATKPQIAR